jgi:hypothetical protein
MYRCHARLVVVDHLADRVSARTAYPHVIAATYRCHAGGGDLSAGGSDLHRCRKVCYRLRPGLLARLSTVHAKAPDSLGGVEVPASSRSDASSCRATGLVCVGGSQQRLFSAVAVPGVHPAGGERSPCPRRLLCVGKSQHADWRRPGMMIGLVTSRTLSGTALVLVVALCAPGWLCFPFLPRRRQDRMLRLLGVLCEWGKYASAPNQ